jgi:hypothetical protein
MHDNVAMRVNAHPISIRMVLQISRGKLAVLKRPIKRVLNFQSIQCRYLLAAADKAGAVILCVIRRSIVPRVNLSRTVEL